MKKSYDDFVDYRMAIALNSVMARLEALHNVEELELGVRETAAERIRIAIVSGEVLPGQRLPMRVLCALTGAAHTTVREAVRRLESEGLITTIPYRGLFVSDLTAAEARDIYELRAMLEGQAGRLFVERAIDAQVVELVRAIEDIGRAHTARDMEGVINSSDEFYRILVEGAANKALGQSLFTIHNRLALFRFSSTRWPGRAERSMAELREIGEAVKARNAEAAASSLVRHIEAAAELALLVLGERASGAAAVGRSRLMGDRA
jgi:DNA-binding GntR family transcriptional regulator